MLPENLGACGKISVWASTGPQAIATKRDNGMEKIPKENQPERGGNPSDKPPPRPAWNPSMAWMLLIAALVIGIFFFGQAPKRSEITYGRFREELERDNIAEAHVRGMRIYGKFGTKTRDDELLPEFYAILPPFVFEDGKFHDLLYQKLGKNYSAEEPPNNDALLMGVYIFVTILLLAGIWFMFRRTQDRVLGGGLLSGFGKSPAKRYESGDQPITFDDVAGLEQAKRELEEIVEFLKDPEKFQRLGGRVPKGVLLMGPPGTGKTLLGRAVAGEAGVPFFSISGSEFIQMFVGVGASRVRDMFTTAKQNAPSILFVDEIDAVGRHRGAGLGGGHDEREQTLNQILSEMDGFTQSESVIVMAATNRPDVLDPALLRPGRFDRHVTVDRPNYRGRLAIFRVHCREVPVADDVDLERLAAGSAGVTGADIRNLVNEAALSATRLGKDEVEMSDFEMAHDKILMGSKREEVLIGEEKLMTAYHEAGHALLAWLTPGSDRMHKVSVIPRGRALGATQILPEEDRLNISESELHTRLAFLLGGRMAEKIRFDEFTAGAEDDLKKATQLARRMVTHWGMSERLGPVAFRASEHHPFLGREMSEPREFSEHTAQVIDEEVVRILRDASKRAEALLQRHRDKLDALASTLNEVEELDERAVERLIGPAATRSKDGADSSAAAARSEADDAAHEK